MINQELKKYIEKKILPFYDDNYIGDGRERVDYVLKRAHQIIKENDLEINENILYTIVSYHDIRKNNEEKNHEQISADILYKDEFLKSYFTENERTLMKEAIEDQRAKKEEEPRNIYGKLLSSASRNSSVDQSLIRSYQYGKKKDPNKTDDEIIEGAYHALLSKFGYNGYAKFYFKDSTYEEFLKEIRKLLSDKEKFIEKQRTLVLKRNEVYMEINKKLKEYIEKNIFPEYEENDKGHNLEHIKYVIDRSLRFATTIDNINLDMVYTIASYHDIGHHLDAKNHEKVSGRILFEDDNLRKFFQEEEIRIMKEAVEDHRASKKKEPRSIYGKIVSSADRNTSVNSAIKRNYEYRKKHNTDSSLEEIIEDSRVHLLDKFGSNGYAKEKMYFKDIEYQNFLKEITKLTKDKEEFRKRFIEVNQII